MKGAATADTSATYGTRNIPAPENTPGARCGAVSWTDKAGHLWLFGGNQVASESLKFNDLWKFDPATGNWTWMKGASTPDQAGTYGALGAPAPANAPGARFGAVSWTDATGNLWLFGGYGLGSAGSADQLNDLWKHEPATGNWTWMKGAATGGQDGAYGTQGVAAPDNTPGARQGATSWTDKTGNLWLFGGWRVAPAFRAYYNDLWKYDPATGNWTWMKGASFAYQPGLYGTRGVPAPGNTPGAREGALSWSDNAGNLWLFGGSIHTSGEGMHAVASTAYFNDLWRYNIASGYWTWIKGAAKPNQAAVSGPLAIPAPDNTPGAREGAVSWTDKTGNFWLFGGMGYDCAGYGACLNDLWRGSYTTAACQPWQLYR